MRRRVAALSAAVLTTGLLTGCGPTVTMPDVVGMRLDDAHRTLEDLGVDEFDDVDVVGNDRHTFLDANWVVISQSPAAGTREVDTGTTVRLEVGKVSDDGILGLIPAGSPVAEELAAEAAEEAEEQAEEEAEEQADAAREAAEKAEEEREEAADRLAAAREYAKQVDQVAKAFVEVYAMYVRNADRVHAEGGGPVVAAENALAAQEFFDVAADRMTISLAPGDVDELDDVHSDAAQAATSLSLAAQELLSAIDTGAPSAFARELRYRDEGMRGWVSAMRRIYAAAERKPIIP